MFYAFSHLYFACWTSADHSHATKNPKMLRFPENPTFNPPFTVPHKNIMFYSPCLGAVSKVGVLSLTLKKYQRPWWHHSGLLSLRFTSNFQRGWTSLISEESSEDFRILAINYTWKSTRTLYITNSLTSCFEKIFPIIMAANVHKLRISAQ